MALQQATQLFGRFKDAYAKNDVANAETLLSQLKVRCVNACSS